MLHKRANLAGVSMLTMLALLASLLSIPAPKTEASSHREAPLISNDPLVDTTDVYAFVSPDKPDTVTLIAGYIPFEEPVGGPNYFNFDPTALYSIKIDNDGDAKEDISYDFAFKTTVQNGNTFLYNVGPITSLTDPNWNVRQTYTVTRVEDGKSDVLGADLPVPPNNVGAKSTPNYENLAKAAIKTLDNGVTAFAGQRDDPFFVDLNVFDLLTLRNPGVDGLGGYNIHAIALQIPINQLTKTKTKITDPKADGAVIGVWSTAYRHATRVLKTSDPYMENTGDWVQVSRLGAPLVNEVVIPLKDKDSWNATKPENDTKFANYVTNPELGILFKALYNIKVPPQADFGQKDARDDLVAIFLTGIDGLTKPTNVVPSEQLRLNVGIAPTSTPNRMGVLGGDTAGYPNGRRLADDVTDISLQAVAGAVYPLFHKDFQPDPLATKVGDGVDRNDKEFTGSFPYMASPWDGTSSVPHGKASTPQTNVNASNPNANTSVSFPFPDVTATDDYASIQFIKDKGWAAGYPDGTFGPDNQITRYEFIKLALLAKYQNTDITGSTSPFKDVPVDQWYSRFVFFAKAKGIIGGYSDGTFRGNNNITIEEAYKILGTMFFTPASGNTDPWYKKYVDLAVSKGYNILGIKVGNFISRENMATMLTKILKGM